MNMTIRELAEKIMETEGISYTNIHEIYYSLFNDDMELWDNFDIVVSKSKAEELRILLAKYFQLSIDNITIGDDCADTNTKLMLNLKFGRDEKFLVISALRAKWLKQSKVDYTAMKLEYMRDNEMRESFLINQLDFYINGYVSKQQFDELSSGKEVKFIFDDTIAFDKTDVVYLAILLDNYFQCDYSFNLKINKEAVNTKALFATLQFDKKFNTKKLNKLLKELE